MPATSEDWTRISTAFEDKTGIPNAIGAIDNSLIRVYRPHDF
jgi:hypothetical protein